MRYIFGNLVSIDRAEMFVLRRINVQKWSCGVCDGITGIIRTEILQFA